MGENISTRVAYGLALEEFGDRDNVYVFDADLKSCTMTQYFSEKYPERFFNIGIAEANMVDIAAGYLWGCFSGTYLCGIRSGAYL